MSRTSETGISLYALGDAFSGRKFDLRAFERIIYNYRLIVDNTLPLVINQRKLSDKIKEQVKYEVEVKEGSLELILNFILENKELLEHPEILIALGTDGGQQLASGVTKLISGAIDLRRALTLILQNGVKPTIRIDQKITDNSININNSVNYNVESGNIIVNNYQYVLCADATKPQFDRLITGIDGHNVSKIDFSHKATRTELTTKDHNITGTQKEELANHIEVIGRLDMVSVTSHKAHIVTGESRYPVTWDEAQRKKIIRFLDADGIVFRVKPIIDHRRFKGDPVAFHVLDCWEPQSRFDI